MAGLLLLGGCKSGKSESKNSISIVKGIESDADSVLVNHVIVNSMEAATPASLSASVHQLLRNQLKFKDIIMTDDLAMDTCCLWG